MVSNISVINFEFRKKSNGVPILSKDDIDYYAEVILQDFKPELLRTPQPTPVEDFVELYLDLSVDYHNLSSDGSVLGMIAFNDGYVEVYDDDNNKQLLEVSEGTVFVDNTLLEDDQRGRCRFTFGHEPGHWIFHRHRYLVDKNQITIFDLINEPQQQNVYVKCHKNNVGKISRKNGGFTDDDDWMEWQADYFSSAMLMPKKIFRLATEDVMARLGLKRDYFQRMQPSKSFMHARMLASDLAHTFDVSFQASAVRLYKLGYIEQNLLSLILTV
jgi:Zn-dependent peptidase ImmA (M78 family)